MKTTYTAKINDKGQFTIPKKVREELQISNKSTIALSVSNRVLTITRKRDVVTLSDIRKMFQSKLKGKEILTTSEIYKRLPKSAFENGLH